MADQLQIVGGVLKAHARRDLKDAYDRNELVVAIFRALGSAGFVVGPREQAGVQEPCTVCGDTEPSHVHHNGLRIDDYFTVGRGETDFDAAVRWKRRALAAERGLQPDREGEAERG